MPRLRFKAFLSIDSAKASKATEYGYLNGINYMAPSDTAGLGDMCASASPACIALCLGKYSGQAAMVADLENGSNSVRASRKAKVAYFMNEANTFMCEAAVHVAKLVAKARKAGLVPCVRMNGATDIRWENVKFTVDAETSRKSGLATGKYANIYVAFPEVQFVDYTKHYSRFAKPLPANLSLTFSRSETNDGAAEALLHRGFNVAYVFRNGLPTTWRGFDVIDGDKHDLRHLDPRAARGYVVGLSPKGAKAKADTSGFVIDWR